MEELLGEILEELFKIRTLLEKKRKPPVKKQLTKEAIECINLFNNILGKKVFTYNYSADKAQISARIKEHGLNNVRKVITYMGTQWAGNEKWEKYLRPATICSKSKFEGYLGQANSQQTMGDFYDSNSN